MPLYLCPYTYAPLHLLNTSVPLPYLYPSTLPLPLYPTTAPLPIHLLPSASAFDILVTNPPYSGEHKPQLLTFLQKHTHAPGTGTGTGTGTRAGTGAGTGAGADTTVAGAGAGSAGVAGAGWAGSRVGAGAGTVARAAVAGEAGTEGAGAAVTSGAGTEGAAGAGAGARAGAVDAGVPFALLMPVYVASKAYWRDFAAQQAAAGKPVFYLLPPDHYEYSHPEGTGKDIPPFFRPGFWAVSRALTGSG
eukprot:CAMPEP_0173333972 /NCGR_PEP_ID=MMETSP1144-20121109/5181_1 /TAXON_ID=483371 /ORGANISM="non described non described, Strain CCMP2298" /LENGTH=246 /DNA_ID=CAMNT_0014278979 /DNA_START=487 /DNA_END=1228 /DNA_ORIENTATION=-